jgi:hypothetical protein
MTLDEMCTMAARYSDRYDEFEKNAEGEYEDDALHYFNVFRDGINEAYREVSRLQAMPDTYTSAKIARDGTIDLTAVFPQVYQLKDIFTESKAATAAYVFETKYKVAVTYGAKPGDSVWLYYHYMPDPLEGLNDEPVFSDAIVDPALYVALAVARMWQSEKKMDFFMQWYNQYREHLRNVRGTMKALSKMRIPRRLFR